MNQIAPPPVRVRALKPTDTGAARVPREEALPLLARFWRDHVREHRATLILTIVAIAFVAASTSTYPLIINWAFDAFAEKSRWAIHTLPWLILAAACVRGISTYTQVWLTQRVVTRVEMDVQRRLYGHLIAADLAQIDAESPAAWTQRFTTDLNYVRLALTRTINILLR
ncbi:MAG: ABC transporter transmembrane domain-containing protein, partial [Pseudomonadota bacterium]